MEYLAHNIQKADKYVCVQNGCAVHVSVAASASVLGGAGGGAFLPGQSTCSCLEVNLSFGNHSHA